MNKLDHYQIPEFVDVYDTLNQFADDTKFYIDLVNELDPNKILDIGCGTGFLTSHLIDTKRGVFGLEPAKLMIDKARENFKDLNITWLEGFSSDYVDDYSGNMDLVIMTGHVSQVFIDNDTWLGVLNDVNRFLEKDGIFVFEMRNAFVKPWENWRGDVTVKKDPKHGEFEFSVETINFDEEKVVVEYQGKCKFLDSSNKTYTHDDVLKFRTLDELKDSLYKNGFKVLEVYGNWDKSKFDENSSPEIIIKAQKR